MNITIIKYNAGNIHSVRLALQRLGIDPLVSERPADIISADKVIFPGVGEASSAMAYLKSRGIDDVIRNLKQPVLGICLGLQLLAGSSEENNTTGLGVLPGSVRHFPPGKKVPHMGWNSIHKFNSPLFAGLKEGEFVYFVHSYYLEVTEQTIAKTEYMVQFSAAVQFENFYAVQFHPEKSGASGEKILRNFIEL